MIILIIRERVVFCPFALATPYSNVRSVVMGGYQSWFTTASPIFFVRKIAFFL